MLPVYEVFALRYATRGGRRPEHFIGGDPHDTEMPMDYFVWLIRGNERSFVVDTGFTAAMASKRQRTFLRCPVESLALLDVAPARVTDVILTHLHYDHVGNFERFPAARFHLQEREMAYAAGRYMKYPFFSHAYEAQDVAGLVHLLHAGRVELYEGETELAPGVLLHPAPGHTAGLQVVRVHTRRGWVVLASDATHYYENLESNRPFPVAFHLGQMLDSFRTVERLAESPEHIVPGHDPLVMRRYAPPSAGLAGQVVCLDAAPRTRET
jgi:glyoxylase-like metal-dependent hydrolase (beta-lactamase superfamily II)